MDTAAIIVALLTGTGALITAVLTARNAASKDQFDSLCRLYDQLQEDNKALREENGTLRDRVASLEQKLHDAYAWIRQVTSDLLKRGIDVKPGPELEASLEKIGGGHAQGAGGD